MDCSQAPVSMKFSRQEYWSGLCFLLHGDLHDPGIEPTSPALQADSLSLYHLESPMSNKYTFIWVGKNKDSESIPCSTENQRGPGLSLLCTVFSFSRLQFVLASVKSVQDICINIYTHIYIGEL